MREIHVCDVEFEDQIARLRDELAARGHKFAGLLHSIAFADYDGRHEAVSRNAQAGVSAGDGHLVLFADGAVECPEGPAGAGCLGRDRLDLDDADGQRELRLHGADQGGPRFVAGVSGQELQPVFAGAVQRRRAGPA